MHVVDGLVAFGDQHVYWAQAVFKRDTRGRFRYHQQLIETSLGNGSQRTLFTTSNYGFTGLEAGGDRVLFGLQRSSTNSSHFRSSSRLYVYDHSRRWPRPLAQGTAYTPHSAAPSSLSANRLCGKNYQPRAVSPQGDLAYWLSDAGRCSEVKPARYSQSVVVVSPSGATRSYDANDDYGSLMFFAGRRIGSKDVPAGEAFFDRDTGATLDRPATTHPEDLDWTDARGSDAAFVERGEDWYSEAKAVLLTNNGVFNPFAKISLPAHSAGDVALCGPGAVILRARLRTTTTSANYTQFPGSGRLTLTQVTGNGRRLAKSTLASRAIEAIGCDASFAYLVVAKRQGPTLLKRALVPWG